MRTTRYTMILATLSITAVGIAAAAQAAPAAPAGAGGATDSKPVLPSGSPSATTRPDRGGPRIYVPYADLAAVVDPAAKAVLMDRAQFNKLLESARAARAEADAAIPPPAAQAAAVTTAAYTADVSGDKVTLAGDLIIQSNTNGPVAMALPFGQIGLTGLILDGKPAPLGIDQDGKLVLVVTGRGEHKLAVVATAALKSLTGGGQPAGEAGPASQFGMSMPPAVAGTIRLTAPGDLEIHTTAAAPVSPPTYDKQADRTAAEIAIGGQSSVTILLLGNGRGLPDDGAARSILLGESVTRVQLTPTSQELHCLYTVQILRRGVRELRFALPAEPGLPGQPWTVTDVSCANLTKWSIEKDNVLLVQLGSARGSLPRHTVVVHIQASAPMAGATLAGVPKVGAGLKPVPPGAWTSPRISLVGANFQRGYLIVDTGEQLRARGQKLTDARQEDPAALNLPGQAAANVLALFGGSTGLPTQWFYHWGENWSAQLDLAVIDLRRSSDDRQMVLVSPEQISLIGQFNVTAVGQEMFDVSFELPGLPQWDLDRVTVNDKPDGFQYHLAEVDAAGAALLPSPALPSAALAAPVGNEPKGAARAARILRVELPNAVRPEGVVKIGIALHHVPADWNWNAEKGQPTTAPGCPPDQAAPAAPLDGANVSVPLIRPRVDTSTGVVGVAAVDLDVSADQAAPAAAAPAGPAALKPVNVGRLASLGLDSTVRAGFTYNGGTGFQPVLPPLRLTVTRPRPRVTADSIGLVTALGSPSGLTGDWLITYAVSRGQVNKLYLRADKSLGQAVQIEVAGLPSAGGAPGQTGVARFVSKRIIEDAKGPQAKGAAKPGCPPGSTQPEDSSGSLPSYNLWELTLDGAARSGALVPIRVHYDQPGQPALGQPALGKEHTTTVPLIRPAGVDQASELLAIQASEELALQIDSGKGGAGAVGAAGAAVTEIDTIELTALPVPAQRVLAAFRIEGSLEGLQSWPKIMLKTTAHDRYSVPAAIATSASLVTQLGPIGEEGQPAIGGDGGMAISQTTEATYRIVNAGLQFLRVKLPPGGELWSVRVQGQSAKPGRDTAGNYLLALPRSTEPFEVRVLYAVKTAPSSAGDRVQLAGLTLPDLGSQINRSSWQVIPPPGFEIKTTLSEGTQIAPQREGRGHPRAEVAPACMEVLRWLHDAVQSPAGKAAPQKAIDIAAAAQGPARKGSPLIESEDEVSDGREAYMYIRRDIGTIPATQADSTRARAYAHLRELPGKPVDIRVSAQGRYTLPVDLPQLARAGSASGGQPVTFTGQSGNLTVTLAPVSQRKTWRAIGFVLAALLGMIRLRSGARRKLRLVVAILLVSTVAAFATVTAAPMATAFANGAFYAGLALIGFYVVAAIITRICQTGRGRTGTSPQPPSAGPDEGSKKDDAAQALQRMTLPPSAGPDEGSPPNPVAVSLFVAALFLGLIGGSPALAGGPEATPPAPALAERPMPPIIIPYDGDPTKLDGAKAEKVLVPYERYVELWNQANPDNPLYLGPFSGLPNRIVIAGAHFDAAIETLPSQGGHGPSQTRMNIVLTATIKTIRSAAPAAPAASGQAAPAWVTLPMPMENAAITEATLDGQPVQLQTIPALEGSKEGAIKGDAGQKGGQPRPPSHIALLLKGEMGGQLVVKAVATPKATGGGAEGSRRGSIDLVLPPMPAATMTLKLPADDLVLEAAADGVDIPPATLVQNGAVWTVPLNLSSRLSLRWSPRAIAGAADRTLSADSAHSVYAFQWALVGVSKLTFNFSAGAGSAPAGPAAVAGAAQPGNDNDRGSFVILVPEGVTITDVSGLPSTTAPDTIIDGDKFRVLEVRPYKGSQAALPAVKQQQFVVRWLAALPAMDAGAALAALPLPRAGNVGRESGTLTLYTAPGVALQVTDVAGGRRAEFVVAPPPTTDKTAAATGSPGPDGVAGQAGQPRAIGESASLVGQYYWPYRPFSIKVRFSRESAKAYARLDQLVRVTKEQVLLLARAQVFATGGGAVGAAGQPGQPKLFAANFAVPDGYEVLSVTGPAVGEWHVQPASAPGVGRRLQITLTGAGGPGRGQPAPTEADFAIVCARPEPGAALFTRFDVPMLRAIDQNGLPLPGPIDNSPGRGPSRLAVQIAPALEAQTAAIDNLKSVVPSSLDGWLDNAQIAAVQFAYHQERPDAGAALQLAIAAKPTKVRVEILASVAVQPASAWYTYRLRYLIDGSPVDHVSFDLPAEFSKLAAVNLTPAIRSVSQTELALPFGWTGRDQDLVPMPGGTSAGIEGSRVRWTVWLVNEVTSTQDKPLDITLNFVVPIDRKTDSLAIPRVTTTAPDGYRAVIAVQDLSGTGSSGSRREVTVAERTNLSDVPASGQAELLGAFSKSRPLKSLVCVLESYTDDWKATLSLRSAAPAAPAEAAKVTKAKAIIDLMAITTALGRDGAARYDVTLTIQNHSEQFLPVRLPAGFKLWAAAVSGVPVRPVIDETDKGVVLIPLVKTSPGGLPYDVRLYLAGQATEPLDYVRRLNLPAVRIGGTIQVVRTTWSLRLPAGYSYFARGGNMSQLASRAEIKSLAIDAEIEQFSRLLQTRDEVGSSARGAATLNYNAGYLSNDLQTKLSGQEKYLAENRTSIGDASYGMLTAKVQDQKKALSAKQQTFQRQNQQEAEQIAGTFNYDLNGYTGTVITNNGAAGSTLNWRGTLQTGTAENVRNNPLLVVPDFVVTAGKKQQEVLNKELAQAQHEEKEASEAVAGKEAGKVTGTGKLTKTGAGAVGYTKYVGDKDFTATIDAGALVAEADREETASRLLEESRIENARQYQQQVQNRLSSLSDNRAQRLFDKAGNASLNISGANAITGTSSLDLNGTSQTVGGLAPNARPNSYSGPIAVQGGANLTLDNTGNAGQPNGQDGRFSAGRVAQPNIGTWSTATGNGTLRVNNAGNTFGGATVNLNGGEVNLGATGNTLNITNGGNLAITGNGAIVLQPGNPNLPNATYNVTGMATHGDYVNNGAGNLTLNSLDAQLGAARAGSGTISGVITMDNSRNVDGAISGGDQIAVWAGGQIAVAGGTFSLPVELPEMPEGGVQMDFSYPAGDPELAIVAVHQDVIRTTWAGGVAIAAILVLWVLGLACRRVARARKAH